MRRLIASKSIRSSICVTHLVHDGQRCTGYARSTNVHALAARPTFFYVFVFSLVVFGFAFGVIKEIRFRNDKKKASRKMLSRRRRRSSSILWNVIREQAKTSVNKNRAQFNRRAKQI